MAIRSRKHPSSLENILASENRLYEPEAVIEEEASIESTHEKKWPAAAYVPPPLIPQRVILAVGVLFFLLAVLWPPLILVVAYIASKVIPYSFRVNDSATTRRQLFQRFKEEEEIRFALRSIPDHVHVEESYWTNSRYVCEAPGFTCHD